MSGAHRRGDEPEMTVVMPVTSVTASETTMDLPVIVGETPRGPAAEPDDTGAVVARHGTAMAVGSIVSRLTGFLRTIVIGAAIGAAAVSDDYNLANTLPNMVYELLLGGVLASVVVPLLVRAKVRDADAGLAYSQRLLSLATVFLGGATVLAVAAAPLLTSLFTSARTSSADRHLVTVLGYLLLPEIFFYGMAAVFAAILNTRGHFAAPMWTPILNNLVVIATASAFMLLPMVRPPAASSVPTLAVAVLGIGTTLGIVVQASGLWPALRRVGFRWQWRWDLRQLGLRQLASVGGWMLGYVLVSQLGVLVVLKLAYLAGQQGSTGNPIPGPAIYNNAYLIFMTVHGIIAVSIITALMPRMASAAASGRHQELAHQLSLGTRLSAVVLLPATAGYLVLGRPIGVSLFSVGQYTQQQAAATGWVIAVAGLGLVPFAISQLQTFAMWAAPDTRTPALLNVPVVVLRVGADLLLYVALPAFWVDAGLMAGNAVSFVLATTLGYWVLRRRLGALGLGEVFATLGRLALAAVAAGLLAWAAVAALAAVAGDGKLANVAQLVVGAVVLLGSYVAVAFALRVPEIRNLSAIVRTRAGR